MCLEDELVGGEKGCEERVFGEKEFVCCMVEVKDDFWPDREVFRNHFAEEIDRIIGVLFVESVAVLVLELWFDVACHTQQELLIKGKILFVNLQFSDSCVVSNFWKEYFSSGAAFLEAKVDLHKLCEAESWMLIILVFGDVDEAIQAKL